MIERKFDIQFSPKFKKQLNVLGLDEYEEEIFMVNLKHFCAQTNKSDHKCVLQNGKLYFELSVFVLGQSFLVFSEVDDIDVTFFAIEEI